MSRNTAPTRSLRAHPDLDQLRRQAKELLSAFRGGDADAVAEVTLHYRDADASTFALHDAQLVLARAYGFDSWPKLKAFVDRATVSRLSDAVRAGDTARVTTLLEARPEIINMEGPGGDEHRPLHHAVLARDAGMVRLLMAHGADARIGIYPHRVPTMAMATATERGYEEIVKIIREAEGRRHGGRSPGHYAEPTPWPQEVEDAICRDDSRTNDASSVRASTDTRTGPMDSAAQAIRSVIHTGNRGRVLFVLAQPELATARTPRCTRIVWPCRGGCQG